MITPRRTRLVRVANLGSYRRTIASLCRAVADPRALLLVVPSRAAASHLRDSLTRTGGVTTDSIPELVTREQMYDTLHARLPGAPRRLGPLERDALAQAAASEARETGPPPSFQLRPGLVSEMLAFYDQLRRQAQTVARFEALLEDALESAAGDDRGAERMLRQTRFLAGMFRAYERRAAASGACDEHRLRELLLAGPLSPPLRHVILTIADWIADPDGLFVADFDLLARLPALQTLDIVATAGLLDSGLRERLERWLPDVEASDEPPPAASGPVLVVPGGQDSASWWTHRDREEELAMVARQCTRRDRPGRRTAVVYKRPLPYLYLAPDTLGAAGVAYQTHDALPLAADPAAAAVDLILDFVESTFAREAAVALVRSAHFRFEYDAGEVTPASASALDRLLSDARYLGDRSRLQQIAAGEVPTLARPALQAAVASAEALSPLTEEAAASVQVGILTAFLVRHLRPIDDGDPCAARSRGVRQAMLDLLARLAAARATHDDRGWRIDELAAAVRRSLAAETCPAEPGEALVSLVDDRAARYGEFDSLVLVGLVEDEWPERARRNIFYPPRFLGALGWPSEKDRRAAGEARFLDLLASASSDVTLSTFALENDAVVMRSSLLDEVARARLTAAPSGGDPAGSVLPEDALAAEAIDLDRLRERPRAWLALRRSRPSGDEPPFHGYIGSLPRPLTWSVSALETYLGCPFKFFAEHVLGLEAEPEDEEVMDPRRQGAFVHGVFERFFETWQAGGRGAIGERELNEARELFASVTEEALTALPAPEAALERTRLLGSPAAAGLGEAVLRMEAERPEPIVERLLEYRLSGPVTLATASGPRTVVLRGVADRLDLLANGTFRLVDYKLGLPPQRSRALQLPIYALGAEARLLNYRGRRWTLGEALYLAFRGPRRVVPLFTTPADRDRVLQDAQQRLADTLDGIEHGRFPPTPDDVFRCESCSFPSVCRKDYIDDV